MPKLKLLPSLREKKRYLAYQVLSPQPLSKDFSNHLFRHTQRVLGLFDSAQTGLQNVQYDAQKQKGVLRIGHKYVDKVRTALILLQSYDSKEVLCRTLTVSCMLGKAKEKAT